MYRILSIATNSRFSAHGLALVMLACLSLPALGLGQTNSTVVPGDAAKVEPFDLSYRPAGSDGISAVVGIRPALLVSQPGMQPVVKQLRKLWDEFQAESHHEPLPDGLTLADIDQIVVNVERKDNERLLRIADNSVKFFANFTDCYLVVHMRRDVDWEKVLIALFGKVSVTKQDGKSIYAIRFPVIADDCELNYCAIDARTLIRVDRPVVRFPIFGMGVMPISIMDQTFKSGPFLIPAKGDGTIIELGEAWKKVENLPFAIGFDNHSDYWSNPNVDAPARIKDILDLFSSADSLCFGVNFGPELEGHIAIQEKAGARIVDVVAGLYGLSNLFEYAAP